MKLLAGVCPPFPDWRWAGRSDSLGLFWFADTPQDFSPAVAAMLWIPRTSCRMGGWANRLAHKDFADVIGVIVFADLSDLVAIEPEIEMIPIGVLLPVSRRGI